MERKALDEGYILELGEKEFIIEKLISTDGASVICYRAYNGNSSGILKEFWPENMDGLYKNSEGRIECYPPSRDIFDDRKGKYLEAYNKINSAKKTQPELQRFIPFWEEYDENGNLYIWMPESEVMPFEDYCSLMHEDPGYNRKYRLHQAVSAVQTLAECVRLLHCQGLLYRDIKPSNFGLAKKGSDDISPQNLTLFDIDTVCSLKEAEDQAAGTEGYIDPKIKTGQRHTDNKTDIYAIGATLFHALVVTEETRKNGFLYAPAFEKKLAKMVNESELLEESDKKVKSKLSAILRKCFSYEYDGCDGLIGDLTELCSSARIDMLKEPDDFSCFLAVLCSLYEHPLYEPVKKEITESTNNDIPLNILLIGQGKHSHRVLDACLQAGQMPRIRLHVAVLYKNEAEMKKYRDSYIQSRPALDKFFSVDAENGKELSDVGDSYGEIVFTAADDPEKYLHEHQNTHYIIIASDDDDDNRSIALNVKDISENSTVSYITSGSSGDDGAGVCPICLKNFRNIVSFPEIERMALNVHLTWYPDLHDEYKTIKKRFRERYNYVSCISNAVSLKYKLMSIGIDINEQNRLRAAEEFNEKKDAFRDTLIWMEHRRWVTEKICFGWVRKVPDKNFDGITKDEAHKEHVCIVKSRPDNMLDELYGRNKDWPEPKDKETGELDELDRLSVIMHGIYANVPADNYGFWMHTENISRYVSGDKKAYSDFREWVSCIRDVLNGQRNKYKLLKGLRASFYNTLNNQSKFSPAKRRVVLAEAEALEACCDHALKSKEYKNWKNLDADLIDNIPFILTYTDKAWLAVPFWTNTGKFRAFSNVSAALTADPERLIYLCEAESDKDIKDVSNSLLSVYRIKRKKNLRAKISLMILSSKKNELFKDEKKSKELKNIKDILNELIRIQFIQLKRRSKDKESLSDILRRADIRIFGSYDELRECLENYSINKNRNRQFFAIGKNNHPFSRKLEKNGFYEALPAFIFDEGKTIFSDYKKEAGKCGMLVYIRRNEYFTVADMTAFRGHTFLSNDNPEFFDDVVSMWELYKKNTGAWKSLCNDLSNYNSKNDLAVETEEIKNRAEYRYVLPAACRANAERISLYFKNEKTDTIKISLKDRTIDTFEVKIEDRCGNKKVFDRLFGGNFYMLMQPLYVSELYKKKEKNKLRIHIVLDDLRVSGFVFSDTSGLLPELQKRGFIAGLYNIKNDGKQLFSFWFTSAQSKRLLTSAGRMFEIYVFQKLRECRKFSDIESSCRIKWSGNAEQTGRSESNEIDAVVTKGFRSLVIECKARNEIEKKELNDILKKLETITINAGINAQAVLIADMDSSISKEYKQKANDMKIKIVTDLDEITNIDKTLLDIIGGNYNPKAE